MIKSFGDKFKHYEKLPKTIQDQVKLNISRIINESFLNPADEDYITARFFAHRKMNRAFFWSAAQAIEKYLKAFILMRGKSVKMKNGHNIYDLYTVACNEDPCLFKATTNFHKDIKIRPDIEDFLIKPNITEFLQVIDKHGAPHNRYNALGIRYNTGYLFALDSFIHGLRNEIPGSCNRSITHSADEHLENQFYLYNFWFRDGRQFPELPNKEFPMTDGMSYTTLEFMSNPVPPRYSEYVLNWAHANIKMPKKEKDI